MSNRQKMWVIKDADSGHIYSEIMTHTEEEAKQHWKGYVIDNWETCEEYGARCVQVELTEVKG